MIGHLIELGMPIENGTFKTDPTKNERKEATVMKNKPEQPPANPMTFANEPNINLMCAALSRILSAKHNADITITARPKDGADKAEGSKALNIIQAHQNA